MKNKKIWTIRKANADDAASLQQCMHRAYAFYQERMGGKRLPPMGLDYADEIQNYPTWVGEFESRVVGAITMMFEQDFASIANVGVDPDFQGQGLGSGLIRFAESEARKQSYQQVRLATHVLLTENVSLYLHLGWKEIERDKIRVYMKKDI